MDDSEYDEYANEGTEQERNQATDYFTELLEDFCKKNDIGFVSIFDQLIDDKFRTKEEFYLEDKGHLNKKGEELLCKRMKQKGLIAADALVTPEKRRVGQNEKTHNFDRRAYKDATNKDIHQKNNKSTSR